MKIDYVKNNPRDIQLEEDLPPYMTEGVADDIAEIFQTPLSGAYNWDYSVRSVSSIVGIPPLGTTAPAI